MVPRYTTYYVLDIVRDPNQTQQIIQSITARLHGIVTHSSHIHFMKADLGTPELQGLGLLLLAVTTVS